MIDNQKTDPLINNSFDDEEEISVIDLLTVLGENKKKLFLIPFICACITAIISLIITPSYTAKAVFVNSSKPSSSASSQLLDSLGGGLGASVAGALGPNAGDTLAALLQSNSVREQLIEKFDLQDYYRLKNLEDTRKILVNVVKVSSDKKTSLITIEVKDKDPEFAAKIANAHLDALRNLQKRLSKEEAQQRRDYFEQQIEVISQKPFRDPLIQAALMNSLIRQYEAARMDESRESLVIQAVDSASTPIRRTSPKRAMMVLIVGIASFFVMILWIFICNAIKTAKNNPQDASRFEKMINSWSLRKKQ